MSEKIQVRFYELKNYDDVYAHVIAKKLEMSDEEILDFGRLSTEDPKSNFEEAKQEINRVNLTKFQVTDIHDCELLQKYPKLGNVINQVIYLYWNGCEEAWKFITGCTNADNKYISKKYNYNPTKYYSV